MTYRNHPRHLPLEQIHASAVRLGRSRGLAVTADRLATCNVDKQVSAIVERLLPKAWELENDEIIEACAQRLWMLFLQAEINVAV